MDIPKDSYSKRKTEGWVLLASSAVLMLVLFVKLFFTLSPALTRADEALRSGRAIKLEAGLNKDTLRKILTNGNFFADDRDVDLLVDSLSMRLITVGPVDNLGSINKGAFSLVAPVEWKAPDGGVDFQGRLEASRQRLGFDSVLYRQELKNPTAYPPAVNVSTGTHEIKGKILYQDQPMPGTLVQLREHIATLDEDSLYDHVIYARTDNNGEFHFTGLVTDSGYSVLPLKPGFEFGARQGSARLSKDRSFIFTGKPHKVRLIGPIAYAQMKEDGVLLVRTPEEFITSYWLIVGGCILAFFLAHIILWLRKKEPDVFILPLLLLLCSISILLLFSIQNPLTDTLHAAQALQGVIIGLAGFVVFALIDIRKLYTRWWFDALFNFKQKNVYGLRGWTWLVLAIGMALLTLLIGTGPEGSGVKVNIQLGGFTFQPSEITKYLLLLFLAGFFAANEENIRNLSDIRWRFLVSIGVLLGVGVVLALYLLMGDMGPAMVVCFTFLFFYSIARGNLLLTVLAGVVYCLLLNYVPGWLATAISFVAVLVTMIIQRQVKTVKWYGAFAALTDAPVIILLVIAAFAFGDQLPGIGDRLADRKAMWLSQWDNDVFGGDHLAHSYWTLASGGLTGQGPGRGFPNTMPAAHTDMILPSIGEELGWLGLVAVFLVFGILIHRSFLHARRAGQPFSFYLCAGIAIATGIQFLLIAGGSIGLLPLTGVTVPFLSYGKISLIVNLAAMGIVAGISSRPGLAIQTEHLRKYYDFVLGTGILFFLAGIATLMAKLYQVQVVHSKEILVKAARVINRNGLPIYSYNPRIDKLTRILAAGSIYDRNGLVIATSEPRVIKKNMSAYLEAGIDTTKLENLMQKRVVRFYPFEEDLFFWTGDYNTRLFWGQSNGYFAEARHLTSLRGYATSPERRDYVSTEYRPDKFTHPVQKTIKLVSYDYSPLVESLQSGIDTTNEAVRAIKHKDRDIHLTIDAALQKEIQDSLHKSNFKNDRIAVVVMDAGTGDLLASALNPLPNLQMPDLMLLPDRERNKLPKPVTDRDLGMTYATAPGSTAKILTGMAAFNKMGPAAAKVKYTDIYRPEIFRDNPTEQEPFIPKVNYVDMHEAIVNSSNIFFIRMANENSLEEQMAALYQATGMNIDQRGGYDYAPATNKIKQAEDLADWRKEVMNHDRRAYNNPKLMGTKNRYRSPFSGLAWGQSSLTSTPASMARMAGAIANNGVMMPTRYLLKEAGVGQPIATGVDIAGDTTYAGTLTRYMIDQSNQPGKQKIKNLVVAGKSGTPERVINGEIESDGWYVFFAPTPDHRSRTVTCIRIERGKGSSNAVLVANSITRVLEKRGYITSF
ncbi:penicillin-binding protein [Niastella yeongjuensis]|uniref:Penicillin-binding protein n=1 Tax=Niastella yeongjuensis TaxID=354355 RepID=A0A1V9F797_9BACT|nr:FtsW/RodA/SpoVE family cell cycle protein [Niastella yeongjuensis]OQP54300.1 penicillin-binding protein [Niastella yeongjuensis]SEP30667.1 cell division protein FtsW, lipid II flippase [Niastella yeongjuensis]